MKIIMLIFVMLFCAGCEDFDNERCLQTVQKKYPNAKEIRPVPTINFHFLVNTGEEIRLVTVKGSWEKITTDTKFMDLK